MTAEANFWWPDWLWSLPLILLTVVLHVGGLGVLYERAIHLSKRHTAPRWKMPVFVLRLVLAALQAIVLHGVEAAVWAGAYVRLGAIHGWRPAMLFSLNALTSYGHIDAFLPPDWQLMGALEALNGMMLFGLTTAFLFAIIQKIWPWNGRLD